MNERDQTYLEDMLSYGRDAIEFLGDGDAQDLATDKLKRYALIRAVEIVGEAASKVSNETRSDLPDIAWREIVGMRNTLIHGYRGLEPKLLVEAVRDYLPELVTRLHELLGEDPQ
jgi:uncharacterized protein with HEPN domain